MILECAPTAQELLQHMGEAPFTAWNTLCREIEALYDMETLWSTAGKENLYEYKFRRGGKTLCALYVREGGFGFMVIFGRAEREKFEQMRENFSPAIGRIYDAAQTYHDGKWMMFPIIDGDTFQSQLPDFLQLLAVKRKPNRKRA